MNALGGLNRIQVILLSSLAAKAGAEMDEEGSQQGRMDARQHKKRGGQ
jgi:hypothetical protein